MKFPTWLTSPFTSQPKPVTVGRARAATTPNSADTPENDPYWRRLGGGAGNRDLSQIDHRRMVEMCAKSAKMDGICRSHVRLVRSITVGAVEGDAALECADETARAELDTKLRIFWRDPINGWAAALGQFMSGLTVTGSLALTVNTGAISRLTRVGYLDPATFDCMVTEPENCRANVALIRGRVAHPVVREDGTIAMAFAGLGLGAPVKLQVGGHECDYVVGSRVFYVGINQETPDQTLGISDLFPSLDIVRLLDELVFQAVERSINLGAFSLHVKFPKGTPQADIESRMLTIRGDLESGAGRAIGTTDDVTIAAVAATLQAGEWATLESTARTTALIGLGPWPVHIFSEGAGTNVTAAAEQGSAIANILVERQNALRRLVCQIAMYALRQYPECAAALEANPDAKVVLPLPTIVAKNTTRESNVLMVEINALRQMEENGYLTLEAAQREALDCAKRYSFNVTAADVPDPKTVMERRATQAFALPPISPDPEGGDPRGGHRDGEDGKTPEGTPRMAAA